jgi:actin-related protein
MKLLLKRNQTHKKQNLFVSGSFLTKNLTSSHQWLILSVFQVIRIGKERYTVGEALFQPSIMNLEAHGIIEQLVHSISIVSSENHRQLLENTVLCGGTATMTGLFSSVDFFI